MRISYWSSDVCSSDLLGAGLLGDRGGALHDQHELGAVGQVEEQLGTLDITWSLRVLARRCDEELAGQLALDDLAVDLELEGAGERQAAAVGRDGDRGRQLAGRTPIGRASGRERVCKDG